MALTEWSDSERLPDHECAMLFIGLSNKLTKSQKLRLVRMIFAYAKRTPISAVPRSWPPRKHDRAPTIMRERASLIGALSKTTKMIGLLLDALDVLLAPYAAGEAPSAADIQRLRSHSDVWRGQLGWLKKRLAGLTIEPPTASQ